MLADKIKKCQYTGAEKKQLKTYFFPELDWHQMRVK